MEDTSALADRATMNSTLLGTLDCGALKQNWENYAPAYSLITALEDEFYNTS